MGFLIFGDYFASSRKPLMPHVFLRGKYFSSGYLVLIQNLLNVSGVLAFVFQVAPEYLPRRPELTGFVRYHLTLFGFTQPLKPLQHRLTHDFQALPDQSAGLAIRDVCRF
jgi:hypothetical protein